MNNHNQNAHQAVKIIAELKSPIILNSDLTLDALLSYSVYQRTGVMGKAAHDQVPITRASLAAYQIPVASGIQFDGRIHRNETTIGRRFRRDERSMEAFAPNPGSRKCGWHVYDADGGPYTSLFRSFRTQATEYVVWFAQGNPDWILDHMADLHTIGARRNQGFGQLGTITVEPLLFNESASPTEAILVNSVSGRPTRTMPMDAWRALGGQEAGQRIDRAAFEHPVWAEENLALCALADNQLATDY